MTTHQKLLDEACEVLEHRYTAIGTTVLTLCSDELRDYWGKRRAAGRKRRGI